MNKEALLPNQTLSQSLPYSATSSSKDSSQGNQSLTNATISPQKMSSLQNSSLINLGGSQQHQTPPMQERYLSKTQTQIKVTGGSDQPSSSEKIASFPSNQTQRMSSNMLVRQNVFGEDFSPGLKPKNPIGSVGESIMAKDTQLFKISKESTLTQKHLSIGFTGTESMRLEQSVDASLKSMTDPPYPYANNQSLPQTTENRNVTLNNQQFAEIVPQRMKSLPKKSRSFGNSQSNQAASSIGSQLVGAGGVISNSQQQTTQPNSQSHSTNTTFSQQKSTVAITQQPSAYGGKRQSEDGKSLFQNGAQLQLLGNQTNSLFISNGAYIATQVGLTAQNFNIKGYQSNSTSDKPAPAGTDQLFNQTTNALRKLDTSSPVKVKQEMIPPVQSIQTKNNLSKASQDTSPTKITDKQQKPLNSKGIIPTDSQSTKNVASSQQNDPPQDPQQPTTSLFMGGVNQINFRDKIMIHVIDDSKNQKKDFTFSRSLLIKHMKYFDKCLKKISDNDEIDISIHCDASIFEWLLNYIYSLEESEKQMFQTATTKALNWQIRIQKCDGGNEESLMNGLQSNLDMKNVVSILISADFLKIDRLVKECMDYFVLHIEEISKIQVDMSCINSAIIREMARRIKLDRLDILKERKDKLVSRLFMKKLELLLEKEKNYLYKCAYCLRLFTKSQRKDLSCTKGKPFIDFHGQLRAKHTIDKEWDLKKFITYIRETYRISWKEIYWKVWSYLYLFKCRNCQQCFPVAELGNCRYHSQSFKVKITGNGVIGSNYEYQCCGKEIDIYSIIDCSGSREQHGCKIQMHQQDEGVGMTYEQQQKILARVNTHQLIVLENPPSTPIEEVRVKNPVENHTAAKSSEPTVQSGVVAAIIKPSSLNYKISLRQAVQDFVKKESNTDNFTITVEDDCEEGESNQLFQEELDDVLFSVNVSIKKPPTLDSTALPAQWVKEEEKIKKKLERGAINQIKYKVAQQNRQLQEEAAQSIQQSQTIDPLSPTGTSSAITASSSAPISAQQPLPQNPLPQFQAINTNAIVLTPEQVLEAKELMKNKLKQFKKDRLANYDKNRLVQLQDILKKTRVNEAQAIQDSANVSAYQKTISSPRSSSIPSNIKVTTQQMNFGGNQIQPTQQVMTQISAIYNKRSRTSNTSQAAVQGLQNNNGFQNNNNNQYLYKEIESPLITNLQGQDRGKSPPLNQNRKISGNAIDIKDLNKSPRKTVKNISPPSREKGPAPVQVINQQQEDRIVHSPTKIPNMYNANQTFYQHRKTNSSKLPQINTKTLETSNISSTYYQKEQ